MSGSKKRQESRLVYLQDSPIDKKICVVIPIYNSGSYIEGCLKSVCNQTYRDFEIIIVDDCSTDNSVKKIKDIFSDIKIISNFKRLGPEKSRNIGIKNANVSYIAFLDSDALVDENWLKELLTVIDSDTSIGMCASKILSFPDLDIIESAGHALYYDFSPIHIGAGQKATHLNENMAVFGVCFAGAMVRKKIFDEIGLFDEDYGYNLGDDEWSWRARLAGYKCVFASKAIVRHRRLGTRSINQELLFRWEKNRSLSIIKYYSPRMVLISFYYTLKRVIGTLFSRRYKKTKLSFPKIISIILLAWGYTLLTAAIFIKKRKKLSIIKKASCFKMLVWLRKNWVEDKNEKSSFGY